MRARLLAPSLLVLIAAVAVACSRTGDSPVTSAEPTAAAASASAPGSAPASMAPSASASASAGASGGPAAQGTPVEVVGVDYAYQGVESTYTGPVTFSFRNDGTEVHEMVVVRKNDDVTESFPDLLALPEDEAFSKVGFIGVAMAGPGEAAAEAVSATEPGQYLMVCFIPQGTMSIPSQAPDASGPPTGLGDGPPHFTLGMAQEFTIGG